jgi:hypothetical protein
VAVTAYDCWAINSKGKRVDKTGKCEVFLSGDTVDIIEPIGVDAIISWTVEAIDGSGNMQTSSCQVISTKPVPKKE